MRGSEGLGGDGGLEEVLKGVGVGWVRRAEMGGGSGGWQGLCEIWGGRWGAGRGAEWPGRKLEGGWR